jgi:hypothetical protein
MTRCAGLKEPGGGASASCARPCLSRLTVQDLRIFSGNANVELSQQIAEQLGKKLGNITVSRFADGGLAWPGSAR